MKIEIKGIQCDAPGCDYHESEGDWGSTAEEVEAASLKYLNTPCPKCGAPLLTQEDHEAVMSMFALAPIVKEVEEKLYPDGVPEDQIVRLDLNMNGSGNIELK